MSKITAGCEPEEDPQEDNQIATITMNVINMIVPVIVQAMQTTVENTLKESLKMIPEVHESNLRILAKHVFINPNISGEIKLIYSCDHLLLITESSLTST